MRHLRILLPAIMLLWIAPAAQAGVAAYSDGQAKAVETSKETQIRELREQEITQLRIALGRRLPTNRKADLYYRLAELYLEGYRAEFLIEGRIQEKLTNAGQKGSILRGRSRPYLVKGIQASQDILRLGIGYDKMDRVLYFLAFNYGEMDERAQSLRYYRTITEKYPSSPFVLQAYRELGEDAFKHDKYREAQAFLEQALARAKGDPRWLPEIYHRLAWCYYRTRQYPRAIETMKKAISATQADSERYLSVREEALRDMAVFMTEQDQVEQAVSYFQSVAGDKKYYPSILEKLGHEYERSVKTDKAVQVYDSLLKTHPEDEASFRVLAKLVELDLRRGAYGSAIQRLRKGNIVASGEAETESAAQNLRAMVRKTATEHHDRFRKKGERKDLEVAEAFYEVYIDRFLKVSDARNEAPEIRMYLAEVKRDLGKAAEASALYRMVLEGGDARYAREAGSLWVGSLSEALAQAAKSGKGGRSAAPSSLEQQFVEASDRLEGAIPNSDEARKAVLRSAQLLAGYPDSRSAAEDRIKILLKTQPGSGEARTAARLWVQLQADRVPDPKSAAGAKDYDGRAAELTEVLDAVSGNADLMAGDKTHGKGQLAAAVAEQRRRLLVGRIAALETAKDYSGAALAYETFAQTEHKPELIEQAYDNAVGAHTRSGDLDGALKVSQDWLARFPRSQKAVQGARSLATALIISGSFEQAASLLQRLGASSDPEATRTAALLREGLDQQPEARAAWQAYLARRPGSLDAARAALALARSFERSGLASDASKSYKGCLGAPDHGLAAECHARLADLHDRIKDSEEAKRLYAALGGMRGGRGKRGGLSPYVGYGLYRLAEIQERATAFEPLAFPEARLKASLQRRQAFFVGLTRAYLRAVEAGGPWAVAALHRLAAWTTSFANDVDKIEPPAALQGKDLAAFRQGLRAVSSPLRREAMETWRKALARAVDSEVLSPVVPEVADRLSSLRAPKVFRAQGFRGRLRLAGVSADGGKDGREVALGRVRSALMRNARDAGAWTDYGNLIWGEGKPGLAKIMYDRALELSPGDPAALNNRAVVLLSAEGQEDWAAAGEAAALMQQALGKDRLFTPALMNRASLLGYYRVFPAARRIWEQIVTRTQVADAHDGLAVALHGEGAWGEAMAEFRKADAMGAPSGRFARRFHAASRAAERGKSGASECLSELGSTDGELQGFERDSAERLRKECEARSSEG